MRILRVTLAAAATLGLALTLTTSAEANERYTVITQGANL